MGKKKSGSSARAKRRGKSGKYIPDREIDFSDISELTDHEIRNARRVGRPTTGNAKQLIAIRIAPKLLEKIRRLALRKHKPYQTFMHELLEDAVKDAA